MFWLRLKNCISSVAALFLSGGMLACAWALSATSFPQVEGTRTFYLDSSSSQAKMTNTLFPWEIARLRGESVSFSGDEGKALALIADLGGEILFTEEGAGVRSYYCYAPTISGGLLLGETFVNLHVAVGKERVVVGSPIIFGGF